MACEIHKNAITMFYIIGPYRNC